MMKRDFVWVALAAVLGLNTACNSKKVVTQTPVTGSTSAPRFEELPSDVPSAFADAKAWNQGKNCPEGSVLSPFTQYTIEPGEKSHGFKHYYGRSCVIIQTHENETAPRGLASINPLPSSRIEPESITLIPHGPYMWWYESGAKMEQGTFDHGTLAQGAKRYEPDGSFAHYDDE